MRHTRHIGTGMSRLFAKPGPKTRARLVCTLLVALALRALIPLGFMPASDGTLSLMICPAGLPAGLLDGAGMQGMGPATGEGMQMPGGMQMPQHPHPGGGDPGHGHGLMDESYCVFTTGLCSAPPPPLLTALFLLLACVTVIAVTLPAPAGVRLVRLPQARAPPAGS